MKRIILFSLMWGLISFAYAGTEIIPGLEYEVNGNRVTVSGANVWGLNFNLQPDDLSTLSSVQCLLPIAYIPEYPPFVWFEDYHMLSGGAALTSPHTGGIVSFNFEPTASSINFIYSSLLGTSEIAVNGQVVNLVGYSMIVPEPATIALLAAGGFFLTRRKKYN